MSAMVRVLALLLLAIAPLGRALPAERPISDARIGVAAKTSWRWMMGAPGDDRFLVTWASIDRGGQAALFDAAGTQIGDVPVALPLNPAAVFWRNGSWTILGYQVAGRGYVRVDRDGVLLDDTVRPLAVTGTIEAAVWTGTSLVVAYRRNTPREFGVVVFDEDLNLTATHAIGTDPYALFLATDDETALLGYYDQPSRDAPLRTVLLGADGAILRTKDVEDGGRGLAVASRGGGQGYVVLVQTAVEWRAVFQGFHLDHELAKRGVLSGFGRPSALFEYSETLSWDGSAFLFFYVAGGEETAVVRAARISEHGALLDDGVAMPLDGTMRTDTGLAGVSGLGTTLLLFMRGEAANGDDHFLRVRAGRDAAGLLASDEVPLERGAFQQLAPSAVSNATQSLVAWRERVSVTAPHWTFATRVDSNGNVRDPQSLLLATSSCANGTAAVGTDGEGFLVAWYDEAGVMMARIAADGTVGEKTRVQRFREDVCPAGAPSVASNGTDYLVVWRRKGETRDTQLGARVRADGTLIDTVPIDLGATFDGYRIASDGTDYLLAADGRVMRVAANGTLLDPKIGAFSGRRADGDATTLMWWNGTSYSLLQRDDDRYQWVRVAADGPVTKVGEPFFWPLPWTQTLWGTSSFACHGSTCEGLAGTIEDGRYLLRQFDVRDDGTTPSFGLGDASPVAPVLLRDQFETMRLVPFGVPGGRRFVALTRYALDAPYSGISRIFIRPEEQVRGRAVRH
jgi:hypothetical protein